MRGVEWFRKWLFPDEATTTVHDRVERVRKAKERIARVGDRYELMDMTMASLAQEVLPPIPSARRKSRDDDS